MVLTEDEVDFDAQAQAEGTVTDNDDNDDYNDDAEEDDFVDEGNDEGANRVATQGLEELAFALDPLLQTRTAVGRTQTQAQPTSMPVDTRNQAQATPGAHSRWKITARPAAEARGTAVLLRKEDRHLLSKDQLVKLQRSTTEELGHQFQMMSGQTDDQLAECYNLAVRVDALAWRLKKTDTMGGFDIFVRPIDINQALPNPMPRTLPLIDYIDDLTLKLVRASMRFKRYYGQEYDLQDLQWSQELLENSCDEDLRAKIIEKVQAIPDDEMGGAVYYFIMMRLF